MKHGTLLTGLACLTLGAARPATAQDAALGYRLLLGGRIQAVSFRGWQSDSALASSVVVGSTGGFFTNAGIAATCPGTSSQYCYFFRPGDRQNATPLSSTADLTMWGLGVPGLSVRASLRYQTDAGSAQWPGTLPAVQFYEGYAEYARNAVTVRLGRQTFISRLGLTGFDGGQAGARLANGSVEVRLYGGLGFARATAIGLPSSTLSPLGDYLPDQRDFLAGALVGVSLDRLDARVEYQRDADRSASKLLSERAALSASLRPADRWLLTGGADYDLTQSQVGTADISLRYSGGPVQASAMVRRYRPWFPLYSIWAAFSPASSDGLYGSLAVTPTEGIQLRGRAEAIRFNQDGTSSPLVTVETTGWRWAAGAQVTRVKGWTFDAGYTADYGPGAAGNGVDGALSWHADDRVVVRLQGARLVRPLEYRFDDATVTWGGVDAEWSASPRLRLAGGAVYLQQAQARPDAAAYSWNQLRVQARVTLLLEQGSADRLPLPRAVHRTPSGARIGQ